MRALTEQEVRRSFVNCSRGEAKDMVLPKGFADLDWAELDLLGWRDPKAPLRGYLVLATDDGPLGLSLRAADTRMSARTAAMCLLCQTTQPGDALLVLVTGVVVIGLLMLISLVVLFRRSPDVNPTNG